MDGILRKLQDHAAHLPVMIMGMIMAGQWDKIYYIAAIIALIQGALFAREHWRVKTTACCARFNSHDSPEVITSFVKFVMFNKCYAGDYGSTNNGKGESILAPANGTANYRFHDVPLNINVSDPDKYVIQYPHTNQHHDIVMAFSTKTSDRATGSSRSEIINVVVHAPKNVIENFIAFVSICVGEIEASDKKKHFNMNVWSTYNAGWIRRVVDITKTKENMFLSKENESIIYPMLEKFKNQTEMYRGFGNPVKKGIMIYGPPGSGKSSFAHYIAWFFNMELFKVSADALIKQTERAFTSIKNNSVVVINDIDIALGTSIKYKLTLPDELAVYDEVFALTVWNLADDFDVDDVGVLREFVRTWSRTKLCDVRELERLMQVLFDSNNIDHSQMKFLQQYIVETHATETKNTHQLYDIFDGVGYLRGCILIFTTNNLAAIDKTMIRPGRVDLVVKFDHADQSIVDRIFQFAFQRDGPQINQHKIAQSAVISIILATNDYDLSCARVLEMIAGRARAIVA